MISAHGAPTKTSSALYEGPGILLDGSQSILHCIYSMLSTKNAKRSVFHGRVSMIHAKFMPEGGRGGRGGGVIPPNMNHGATTMTMFSLCRMPMMSSSDGKFKNPKGVLGLTDRAELVQDAINREPLATGGRLSQLSPPWEYKTVATRVLVRGEGVGSSSGRV